MPTAASNPTTAPVHHSRNSSSSETHTSGEEEPTGGRKRQISDVLQEAGLSKRLRREGGEDGISQSFAPGMEAKESAQNSRTKVTSGFTPINAVQRGEQSDGGPQPALRGFNREDFTNTNESGSCKHTAQDIFKPLMLEPLELIAERLIQSLGKCSEPEFVDLFEDPNATNSESFDRAVEAFRCLLGSLTFPYAYASSSFIAQHPVNKRNSLRKGNLALILAAVCCTTSELYLTLLEPDFIDIFPRRERESWEDWQLELLLDIRIHFHCLRGRLRGKQESVDLNSLFPTSKDQFPSWQDFGAGVTHFLERCRDAHQMISEGTSAGILDDYCNRRDFLGTLYARLQRHVLPMLEKFPFRMHLIEEEEEKEEDLDDEDFFGRARLAATAALESSNARIETPGLTEAAPVHGLRIDGHYSLAAGVQDNRQGLDAARVKLPHELYQDARIAATVRASQQRPIIQPSSSSHRRPWSNEEEKALLHGLDKVRGPYWSQILAMFGEGGSISEVLRDRNQVQLKDKARNLKLFFLKNGQEVPDFLKLVTGELKTRAPTKAAQHDTDSKSPGVSAANTTGALSTLTKATGGRQHYAEESEEYEETDQPLASTADEGTPADLDQAQEQQKQRDAQDEEMARAIQQALGATRELGRMTRSGKRR